MTTSWWKVDRLLNRHLHIDVRHPGGFTLLELVLVLAVIVAVSAIAVPGIFGVLANRQVARGGNGLRVAMVQARLEAMRTGRTQMMQVEIGGSRFKVEPYYDSSDVTEAGDMIGRGTAAATGGMAMPATPSGVAPAASEPVGPRDPLSPAFDEEILPDSVIFSDAQIQATARSSTIDRAAGAVAGGAGAGGWSQPMLFYADGTTSTAAVTVARESVGRVVVRLRGLTGETRVSEVMP